MAVDKKNITSLNQNAAKSRHDMYVFSWRTINTCLSHTSGNLKPGWTSSFSPSSWRDRLFPIESHTKTGMLLGQHFDRELPRNLNHAYLKQFQNCCSKKLARLFSKIKRRSHLNLWPSPPPSLSKKNNFRSTRQPEHPSESSLPGPGPHGSHSWQWLPQNEKRILFLQYWAAF